jgi:hypothetical protein
VDPITKKYPELSPYQYASNKPTSSIDLDGAESLDYRFGASFSLSFSSKGSVSFNVATSVGLGYTMSAVQAASSANLNVYNGGLGTAGNSSKVQFDVSAAVYLTAGAATYASSQITTINSRTSSPVPNRYAESVTLGNAWSYSSGLAGDGSDGSNRNLFLNLKAGPFSATYSNDDRKLGVLGGSGHDRSFTTSLTASVNTDAIANALQPGKTAFGNMSYGSDIFTGKGRYKGEEAPYPLDPKKGDESNTDGHLFYEQTPYQRSLNKSQKFLSLAGVTIGYDNGAKAQVDQHTGKKTNVFFGIIKIGKTDNPLFQFDQKGTQNVTATVPVNVGGSK